MCTTLNALPLYVFVAVAREEQLHRQEQTTNAGNCDTHLCVSGTGRRTHSSRDAHILLLTAHHKKYRNNSCSILLTTGLRVCASRIYSLSAHRHAAPVEVVWHGDLQGGRRGEGGVGGDAGGGMCLGGTVVRIVLSFLRLMCVCICLLCVCAGD